MGTNYYVAKNLCECCNRYDTEYHIGKSSHGWAFTFQGYKWNKLDSWKQWKEFLKNEIIMDEYGERIDYNWLVQMIETYKSPNHINEHSNKRNLSHYDECVASNYNIEYDWIDSDGYSFTSREFS